MEKAFTAIGNFYNEEGTELVEVPASEEEIYAKIEYIIENNPMGSVLSDEDVKILRSYLPAVGSDEANQDGNGSLQGKGVVSKTAEGCGISVKATGTLSVESRWEQHHDRKQWTGNIDIERTGGDAQVKELAFNFQYISIGQNEEGQFIVLFSSNETRTFNDPYHLADFNNGGKAQASRAAISKFIQWGFFMRATCAVRTDQGTLLV